MVYSGSSIGQETMSEADIAPALIAHFKGKIIPYCPRARRVIVDCAAENRVRIRKHLGIQLKVNYD